MASGSISSIWMLGASQNVAIGASSTQSTAVGTQTRAVRIASTGNCHIAIGQNPTATATSTYIAANIVSEVFRCYPADKVAVIQDGASTGNCNITELTT